MNFFHWLFILGMSINGSVQIYLGLLSTRVYIKLDADYLTIKWDNKVRREIVSLHMIDYVILNDWNFELKLSDGQSKKFSCGSLKYNQVIDVKAYLEENFSKKIKYGE
ncbi:hypothetical protein EH221_07805 [bacterium]|nr:MAG: hypothetical protein EH221_07805 [bacterium]